MAGLIPTICPDGTIYVAVAKWIEEQGTYFRKDLGVNLYPLILAALHKFGLAWPAAAKLWGVLCGSLVVLPLYGWVRRMFDDRVALCAGLLYAFHPKLIEWSPEMVREQTFWLLAALVWYASWRTVFEGRAAWFAALAVLLPAAVLTRFEGLFLYVIPLAWGSRRGDADAGAATTTARIARRFARCRSGSWGRRLLRPQRCIARTIRLLAPLGTGS
ncbi:MAG: glycosyltransferase family 39 protein [Pirellulales bacterium]